MIKKMIEESKIKAQCQSRKGRSWNEFNRGCSKKCRNFNIKPKHVIYEKVLRQNRTFP